MISPRFAGILGVLGASTIWGLSPLFYKLLRDVPTLDVLAHRTLWSAVFFGAIVAFQGRGRAAWTLCASPRTGIVVLCAAAMISVNWALFVLSVQRGFVVEASLGYYIYPLMAVLLGRVLFDERSRPIQLVAVGLAATGVLVLTIGLGAAPWISLALAASFAVYGALKHDLAAHPLVSVTAEVAMLTPLALAWILSHGGAGFLDGVTEALLLLATGPLTALPLVLFSLAAKRLVSATLGILFYLNPTLQFLCGVVIFSEPFTRVHQVAFPLIWGAVALYSISLWRTSRAARRRAGGAGVSGAM